MSVTIIKDLGRAVLEQQEHHAARRKAEAEQKTREDPSTDSDPGTPVPDPRKPDEQ